MTPESILKDAQDRMEHALEHLKHELRGVRTGRATTALVDYIKADYYGAPTELKALAVISVPEPTQLLIKPFDTGSIHEIKKAIETSDLGLNPMVDGKQIRINIPMLSTDRRKQLTAHIRKVAEESKVALRNVRRDANKHADQLNKSPGVNYPEDEIETIKTEIQELLKKRELMVDEVVKSKTEEIMAV